MRFGIWAILKYFFNAGTSIQGHQLERFSNKLTVLYDGSQYNKDLRSCRISPMGDTYVIFSTRSFANFIRKTETKINEGYTQVNEKEFNNMKYL